MEWCLGRSEHWNGSEHPLKLIEWCLGMSERNSVGASTSVDTEASVYVRYWIDADNSLKLMEWCLGMLEN
jgi:hypothetical protein